MKLGWNILLQRQGTSDTIAVCTVQRPLIDATPADFGLSLAEGRQILAALQQLVAQDQINAYDRLRRNCRECGSYRRIKDWRSRTFATATGKVQVKVPRVTVYPACAPLSRTTKTATLSSRKSENSKSSPAGSSAMAWYPEDLCLLCSGRA